MPPVYNLRFDAPDIGTLPLNVSQKATTSGLLKWLSNILGVPKMKITLRNSFTDVTCKTLAELDSNYL